MFKYFIQIVSVSLILFCCSAAAAGNNIVESAYIEDSANALSINDVENLSFTPYQGVLNKGFSSSSYWIRLRVAARHDTAGQPWVLRILPAFLDHIEVYQKIGGQWLKKEVGDRHPYLLRDIESTSFGIFVSPDIEEPFIYARLKTVSTNLISFELLDMRQFMKLEGQRDLILGVLFGINLMFLLWTLFHINTRKDWLLLLMCAFLFLELVMLACMLGFVSRFIFPSDPASADYLTSLVIIVISFLGMLYHRTFIVHEIPVKGLQYAFGVMVALYIVPVMLFFTGHYSKALAINSLFLFFNTFLLLAVPVVFVLRRTFNPFFAWGYFLLGSVLMIGIAPNLGLVKASALNLYGNIYTGLISSLLLIILLRVRQQEKDKIASVAIESVKIANLELEFEKAQRQHQSQFMAMLAHEFRTPLYLLRLVIDSIGPTHKFGTHADQAVRDMHAILERCEQVVRYESISKENLQRSEFNPVAVVEHLILVSNTPDILKLEVLHQQVLNTDKMLFKIIISNLVENAIKYSAPGSEIHICITTRCIENRQYWSFSITNKLGKAGAPNPARLFDKYYRSEKAHNISGSGLGLFLVKSLTELLDGFVEYESTDKQVRFEICFPG